MRIRTMAGIAVAGAAAAVAIVGGVAYAADDNEPTVRIVQDQPAPTEDCPEKAAPEGTGL